MSRVWAAVLRRAVPLLEDARRGESVGSSQPAHEGSEYENSPTLAEFVDELQPFPMVADALTAASRWL
jgi:hypothetical protein